jgi:hypothetical protein
MKANSLYKLTGAALIGSFVLSLAGGLAHPIVDGQSHSVESLTAPLSPWAQLLIYFGALALMVGLPGMFVWLRPHVGKVGLIGIGLYFLGNAISAQGHLVVEALIAPVIAEDPAARHLIPADGSIVDSPLFMIFQVVGGLILVFGLMLTGVGLFRSGVVSPWVGVLAVVGGLLTFVPFPEVPVLTGLLIELPRGLTVAVVGYLMYRASAVLPATPRELVEVSR